MKGLERKLEHYSTLTNQESTMTNAEKIQTILRHDFNQWQTMSKDQLINILFEDRQFFLETEVQQGNEEYLDELLEDVDVRAVWAQPINAN